MKKLLLFLLLLPNLILSQKNQFYLEGNVGTSRLAIETGIDYTDMTLIYEKKKTRDTRKFVGLFCFIIQIKCLWVTGIGLKSHW